jgi:MULE transposase domain
MLSSNSQNETIAYFLRLVKSWNPMVRPSYAMTDCDQAQIAALEAVYPQCKVLLCTWHVLHAIQSHFRTDLFPDLWEEMKSLVRTEDLAEFNKIWDKISTDPAIPQSFVEYVSKQWIPIVHMWSGIGRRSRSIYQESNTNMLLEG